MLELPADVTVTDEPSNSTVISPCSRVAMTATFSLESSVVSSINEVGASARLS